jgi:dTMP kinase
MQRRSKTGTEPDRLEREKVEFFERARQMYLELAKEKRFLVIDANQAVDQIQASIRDRLAELGIS